MLAREGFDGPRVLDNKSTPRRIGGRDRRDGRWSEVRSLRNVEPRTSNFGYRLSRMSCASRGTVYGRWRSFSASCLLEAGDAVGDRILGQVGSGMNVQLLHDAGLMELHCFHRHVEDRGDRLRAAALGDKLQHFPLARGERSGRSLASLAGGWSEDQIQHIFRERRCEIVLVLEDGLDRQAEF